MMQLFKIENHFYIGDFSFEIKEGDLYICISSMYPAKCVKVEKDWVEDYLGNPDLKKFCYKITHSTKKLENVLPLSNKEIKKIFYSDHFYLVNLEILNSKKSFFYYLGFLLAFKICLKFIK